MNRLLQKQCNRTVEAKEICSRYSTDVISSCAFGINSHSLTSDFSPFREAGKKFFDFRYITAVRQLSYFFAHGLAKFFKLKVFDPDASGFLAEAFDFAITERENGKGRKRNDLIDIIIDMKKKDAFQGNFTFGDSKKFKSRYKPSKRLFYFKRDERSLRKPFSFSWLVLRQQVLQFPLRYMKWQ